MTRPGTIIVGASHGGVQAAQSLRQAGYTDPITLISDERGTPYHRPPLSKGYISAPQSGPSLLRPETFFAASDITLLRGTPATDLDRTARSLRVGDQTLHYDHLILATGASARRLPDAEFRNLHTLRNASDAAVLSAELPAARSLVVIGGGFIGLEVAATAAKLGLSVTVVESQPRILARALPEAVSAHIARQHQQAGTRLLTGVSLGAITGRNGRADTVTLSDGTALATDLILIGIGSQPNTALAIDAGLALSAGGILVDDHLRTSDPAIFAIGDCATFPSPFAPTPVRLESVQNAVDQAKCVAACITGTPVPYSALPWFWTEQFDMRIQMAGLPCDGGQLLLRGTPDSGSFSVLHLIGDQLVGAYSVNATADHIAARKLIPSGIRIDPALACDTTRPLKHCLTDSAVSA
jgi:3-phenylpropionate/trans-cinnamate dioxygenase ferredoxin reductase component